MAGVCWSAEISHSIVSVYGSEQCQPHGTRERIGTGWWLVGMSVCVLGGGGGGGGGRGGGRA